MLIALLLFSGTVLNFGIFKFQLRFQFQINPLTNSEKLQLGSEHNGQLVDSVVAMESTQQGWIQMDSEITESARRSAHPKPNPITRRKSLERVDTDRARHFFDTSVVFHIITL